MCAIRSVDDTIIVMEKIKKMVEDYEKGCNMLLELHVRT